MAMRVSMLAVRRRARRPASRRNGQPTKNCTGVARASAISLPQGCSMAPGSMARTTRAIARGIRYDLRRRHCGLSLRLGVRLPAGTAGLMPWWQPMRSTAAWRSPTSTAPAGAIRALPVAKFTSALARPAADRALRWTRTAQEPQVMPWTSKSSAPVPVGAAGSRVVSVMSASPIALSVVGYWAGTS